ncbi:MAG: hypothetical protein AAF242_08335 [Bacteroidota bacterium]
MKLTKKLLLLFNVLALCLMGTTLLAQGPPVDTTGLDAWKPFDGVITVDKMHEVYYILYSALVIVWGYVAKAFNLKSKKIPFVFIVAAGGLVAGGVFAVNGLGAIPLIISFLVSLGLFDLFLKPAGVKLKISSQT